MNNTAADELHAFECAIFRTGSLLSDAMKEFQIITNYERREGFKVMQRRWGGLRVGRFTRKGSERWARWSLRWWWLWEGGVGLGGMGGWWWHQSRAGGEPPSPPQRDNWGGRIPSIFHPSVPSVFGVLRNWIGQIEKVKWIYFCPFCKSFPNHSFHCQQSAALPPIKIQFSNSAFDDIILSMRCNLCSEKLYFGSVIYCSLIGFVSSLILWDASYCEEHYDVKSDLRDIPVLAKSSNKRENILKKLYDLQASNKKAWKIFFGWSKGGKNEVDVNTSHLLLRIKHSCSLTSRTMLMF